MPIKAEKPNDRKIDDQIVYPNNYKYSDIRTWLNNDFYNSAFALNSSYIQTTNVDNSAATTPNSTNKYACDNTQDKVFLLSYKDNFNSNYGFSASTEHSISRRCITTDWTRARGATYTCQKNLDRHFFNGQYWTRSPDGEYKTHAWCISYGVSKDAYACVVDLDGNRKMSVRPALSIKIA